MLRVRARSALINLCAIPDEDVVKNGWITKPPNSKFV